MIETSIRGKVAVVTGAASGIGRAAAMALGRADATVALIDRNEDGLRETEQAVSAGNGEAMSFPFDLGKLAEIPSLVDDILARTGHIDILVQCAGIADSTSVLDVTPELWDRIHAINAKAPFFLMQTVARHMVKRAKGGKIVNVSSSSPFRAIQAPVVYGSAKASMNFFSRIAAEQLGKHDINVNVVAPGLTRTAMPAGADLEAMVASGPNANFFSRVSEPEDVANAILFLCLAESRQMTGQVVHTSAGTVY